ncbi:MAG TPA: wax ester/triacylglycerol synthase family O-acyltransferase [Thermoleophilaceae bacterium]|nr:wax ester/triacylglycerol synthase family O-acyltransferase [Thermoleophilaceae bacterium]
MIERAGDAMPADSLTPLDATFLELEEADDAAHMHIGSIMVFEAHRGTPPTLRRLRRHLGERLGLLPRYRRRLSEPHTGGLHWPAWIDDPDFDIAEHVGEAQLPAPGGDSELFAWAEDFWSRRLDRRRALWEACLLTGLEENRWAIATKTHHALVDGVGSVDVTHLLLDATRRPGRRAGAEPPEPDVSDPDGSFGLLMRGVRGSLYAARHPGRLRDAFLQSKATAEVIVRDEAVPAPRCSLNVPIGATRRFMVVRADLDEIKAIKSELGGTVNDVVLAAVAQGLRVLLLERGEEPPSSGLRAMVPVNVRTAGQRLGLGNRVSSLFVHLPVAEPDPGRRYRLVKAEEDQLKRSGAADGGAGLVALGALAPPVLHSLFARSAFGTRLFNVTVTNVPGPQLPLFAFGARMEEVLPLVPLAADHSIGVAVVSYDGKVFFGLNADERSTPDLDLLADGIGGALNELREVAGTLQALPTRG